MKLKALIFAVIAFCSLALYAAPVTCPKSVVCNNGANPYCVNGETMRDDGIWNYIQVFDPLRRFTNYFYTGSIGWFTDTTGNYYATCVYYNNLNGWAYYRYMTSVQKGYVPYMAGKPQALWGNIFGPDNNSEAYFGMDPTHGQFLQSRHSY